MNFNVPPTQPLRMRTELDAQVEELHDDYLIRCKLYNKILVPTGHARHDKLKETDYSGLWSFSEEYFTALRDEPDLLRGLLKMIL